ncbi:MAG: adenylate/guanylate cyclase domain-containing protein [Eubacteriales bacterium]|nr:adenylate/guanylate cyclase domain-containing protein [Eubacteriales bacterium]
MILPKSEYDSAINALDNILSQTVESIALTDAVPLLDDVADSNKVFKGKLSVLFVDMRKSTDLTDELKAKKMVKVYRAFIRMIIQGIRYAGGFARQFAGDGIMGVFHDSSDEDSVTRSSQKAVNAARYILTLIDYCLNPSLKKYIPDVAVGCGVGICTGDIMITKVGMRGKEADESSENETGIVWVGSTTNYAKKNCDSGNGRLDLIVSNLMLMMKMNKITGMLIIYINKSSHRFIVKELLPLA